MTWLTVFAWLFVLIALTALVSWLVLYVQFRNSVETRWRDAVLGLLAGAKRRNLSQNRERNRLASDREEEVRSLSEEAFRAYLNDISAHELEAYPGIGPATVGKLWDEGYVNLATLRNARIQIHGLGQKRLADIDRAVGDLLRKARSTFEAGDCPQARKLVAQLKQLPAKHERLEARARDRARALEELLVQLQEPAALARQVTFLRWFRPMSNVALVPAEFLEAALPDLDAIVREADERADRDRKRRRAAPMAERVAPTALPIDPPPAALRHAVSHAQPPAHAALDTNKSEDDVPDDAHLMLMELTIQFALGVARADAPVNESERELIRLHVHQRFRYNRVLFNRAEAFRAHFETSAIDLEQCVAAINLHFSPGHRAALLTFAEQILASSGQESAAAAAFLQTLARRLALPPVVPSRKPALLVAPERVSVPPVPSIQPAVRVASASSPPPVSAPPSLPRSKVVAPPSPRRAPVPGPQQTTGPTRQECLALLDIPPTAPLSADLIRRQWNLLSARLAPEKAVSMGPEFVKLAETKRAELRRAAEVLLEPLGGKLEVNLPSPSTQDLRHNPDLDDVFGGM